MCVHLENMRNKEMSIAFWRRVEKLMRKKGMKQVELAQLTGISVGTLSGARTQKTLPVSNNGMKIAEALGTSLEYLLYGTESSTHDEANLEEAFSLIRKSKPASHLVKRIPLLSMEQYKLLELLLDSWGIENDGLTGQEQ